MSNTNLSVAEKLAFFKKCKDDPLFFIENCVTVPSVGGFKLVELYEPQKDIVRTFVKDHFIIMNKSRQTGGSFVTQAICAWLVLFFDNYVIGIISRSGTESSSFNKKVLAILDNISQDFIRPKKEDYEERNANNFKLATTKSELKSQAVSPVSPEGILRGSSIVTLIIDEAAFIRNIPIAFTAIMPATSQAQRVAANQNIPYGNFIISTPNGMKGTGQWYYDQWIKARTNISLYKAMQIHWRAIPGLDDNWYKQQCFALDNDPKRIAQEMELQFISADGSLWNDQIQTYFNKIINDTEYEKDVKVRIFLEGGKLFLFNENYDKNKFYLIGVDTASASGTDYSVIQVIDFVTCTQVAEFIGKMEPLAFARIVKVISHMFPFNLIIVENSGGYGLTVLNDIADDETANFNVYGENKLTGTGKNRKIKHIPGLSTNSKTRPLIIEAMYNQVLDNTEDVISPRLASELLTLSNKNGKIQADTGYNDDIVMAYAFCFYVRKYSPESYNDILKLIESGKGNKDLLIKDEELVNEFVADMAYESSGTQKKGDKYGMKEEEFENILNRYQKNIKGSESYEDKVFDHMLYYDENLENNETLDDEIFITDF